MTHFLDDSQSLPYCKGCGHPQVLQALDEALAAAELDPRRFVIVTDIGCVGLADRLFTSSHTVHALHGRSVAVAAGVRMGDGPTDAEPLKPIVLIGDGGAGIGLLHIVHAAQLNVDVTVLVHNNLIYGMTGGQHSMLTPEGMKTTTTPGGSPVTPLALGAVISAAGAGFFARTVAPGKELAGIIADAIRHPGFACVEVLELCPPYAVKGGGMTGKALRELPETQGLELGILRRDTARPTPAAMQQCPDDLPSLLAGGITPEPAWRRLDRTAQLVIAGRAGERVQSAARLAATAACACGLHVTLRGDNPITQGTGFSLAEVTFSPGPVGYTGLVDPDLVIVTAEDGGRELQAQGLLRPGTARRTIIDTSLDLAPDLDAVRADLRARHGPKKAALGAVIEEIVRAGWWHTDAWRAAIDRLPPTHRGDPESVLANLPQEATP